MTSALIVLAVAGAGGLGAIARFVQDGLIRDHGPSDHPIGTMIINLTGSLLLGLVVGLVVGGLPAGLQAVAGTGFCGGYTTFSTACFETVRLLQQRRWTGALWHGLGTVVIACPLALLGLLAGAALARL